MPQQEIEELRRALTRKHVLDRQGRLLRHTSIPAGAAPQDHTIARHFLAFAGVASPATLQEPYLAAEYQVANLRSLAPALLPTTSVRRLEVLTSGCSQRMLQQLQQLMQDMAAEGMQMTCRARPALHIRELAYSSGIVVTSDRGLDLYRRPRRVQATC
ncbi:MAG: MIT C-terminal domain-containing protein, partial [Candidatus Fonsibacter sp.]